MPDLPPLPVAARSAPDQTTLGVFYALGAFALWGGLPIYFKLMAHVPPIEILAHRVVWTVVLVGLLTAVVKSRLRSVCAGMK